MSKPFLEVQNLRKSFRSGDVQLDVLRGVELQLEQGAVLAITGASGCGKSTLLHILGAMEDADTGRIQLGDSELGELNREERAAFRNREIGFVFQFHHLLPEFSAVENVMLPLLLARRPLKDGLREAQRLLDLVGLSDRAEHRPGELSGGEQQRVALARALVNQPRLLLADEPTGNLDEGTSRQIQELLFEIQEKEGLTSILVTHDTSLARTCEQHLILQAGVLNSAQSL